jgi:hypothetical protein
VFYLSFQSNGNEEIVMSNRMFFATQMQALQRVHSYWEEQHGDAEGDRTAKPLTVTLDREPGAPVEEVANELGLRLGWPVYNHELAERIARDLGVPVSQVDRIDERGQHWLVECLESLTLTPRLTEAGYVRRLVQAIQSLGQRGKCVIVGHGAAEILPVHSTLRVLLVGTPRDRIARLMKKLHLSDRAAERWAEQVGKERARFLRDHFHVDPEAPGNYDLVMNTSRWPAIACAGFIAQALERKAAGQACS